MKMTQDKKSIGKSGEDIACKYLKKKKYKIVEKHFSCRQGEIDIIAEDRNKVLCFVEVKARSSTGFGLPEESVDFRKQKKLTAAAFIYIESRNVVSKEMRFDIVSVDLSDQTARLIKNAFDASI